jgi:nicotinate phosphoribosyltransferase
VSADGVASPLLEPTLLTDLYEITMALSYARERMAAPATFSLFVRDLPADRGFLVASGIQRCLDLLPHVQVGEAELAAFATAMRRSVDDLQPLLGLRFTGDVWAMPEGRVVLANEPLLEVTAPLPEAQLVETLLLNQITFSTAVATKATRCVLAARGKPVVDFSLRRTQGAEAGMEVARISGMVGFAGTSNVAGAVRYDVRAVGTMAHSYVEAFASEEDAFAAFAAAHPGPVTFLVDTYDVMDGVQAAIRTIQRLRLPATCAVRLDSGDLGSLSRQTRAALDAAGLPEATVVISGGLDEYAVDELVREGAPVDIFAVGTKIGVVADAPYLDSAYKLVEYDGRPVMKLSTAKVTLPGPKQVFRRLGQEDVIAERNEQVPDATPLLELMMRGGQRIVAPEPLSVARERLTADLEALPEAAKRIRDPEVARAAPSARLQQLTEEVQGRLRHPRAGPHAPAAPAG